MHTNEILITNRLDEWRKELIAAAKILTGIHLNEFHSIILEVANLCNIKQTNTGTFVKIEDE